MIYLIASIVITSIVFLLFKILESKSVNTLQAIIVNYFVAASMGFAIILIDSETTEINNGLILSAALLAFLFISLFILLAETAQKNGITTAVIANKMSVIIPIILAFILYQESINAKKVISIIGILIGVFLVIYKSNHENKSSLLMPSLLFLGSGVLDSLINYAENNYVSHFNQLTFVSLIFLFSGIYGLLYQFFIKAHYRFKKKNVKWGIILGIPNFFSILFLVKTLQLNNIESSLIFPINNAGIVCLSALLAVLIFKEYLSKINWLGLILCLVCFGILLY